MKKIIGWVLLGVGVLIIGWGIWTSFEIFTAQKLPYQIFKQPQSEEASPAQGKEGDIQAQIQQEMQETIKEQFEKMIAPGSITRLLNLAAWSIFMGILVFAGGKIASLGIQLLKT